MFSKSSAADVLYVGKGEVAHSGIVMSSVTLVNHIYIFYTN